MAQLDVATASLFIPNVPPDRMSNSQPVDAALVVRDVLTIRSISRIGLTYLIAIRCRSSDRDTARRMAILYASTYIDSKVGVRVEENTRLRRHLEN